jgi:superfamily II DNA helicase RecQ
MRLKITEHNGALMVSVQGTRQELVIYEEGGGFELELRELEGERVWWEEPSAFGPVAAHKEAQLITLPVVEKEAQPVISPVVEPESDLFAKLANLRRELAYANGLPPYIIFHDSRSSQAR